MPGTSLHSLRSGIRQGKTLFEHMGIKGHWSTDTRPNAILDWLDSVQEERPNPLKLRNVPLEGTILKGMYSLPTRNFQGMRGVNVLNMEVILEGAIEQKQCHSHKMFVSKAHQFPRFTWEQTYISTLIFVMLLYQKVRD